MKRRGEEGTERECADGDVKGGKGIYKGDDVIWGDDRV